MDCINFASALQNFNEPPYLGSIQQLLFLNIGKTVKIDFQIGTNNFITKSGVIASVGFTYTVLEQADKNFISVDNYAIKFVTFICQ